MIGDVLGQSAHGQCVLRLGVAIELTVVVALSVVVALQINLQLNVVNLSNNCLV